MEFHLVTSYLFYSRFFLLYYFISYLTYCFITFVDEALDTLKSLIPPTAVLIGPNIIKDLDFLGLVPNQDYSEAIDLSELFGVFDPSRNCFVKFSLVKFQI